MKYDVDLNLNRGKKIQMFKTNSIYGKKDIKHFSKKKMNILTRAKM